MDVVLMKALQLILSLSILVVLHEGGHFFFSKLFHVKVEKFFMFFDPYFHLFSTRDKWFTRLFPRFKKNETEYGIGWLPFGGYVKIAGMIDESMDTEQMKQPVQDWEFRAKPAWQRLLIMIGGVLVNFLLALFIMINEIVEFCNQKKHNTKIEGKKYSGYVLFLISGLYPCPGAILVLILSHTLGIMVSGIFSVIAMSAGMMIPIAIAGYLAWFGREGVFRILKDRGNVIRVVSLVLTVASCIFLCIFSIYIAWPFLITVL